MKVYKFGGASINNVERIKNTAQIIGQHAGDKLLVVVSAMGKTTNALEAVVNAFTNGRQEEALELFDALKQQHINLIKYLTTLRWQQAENQLKDFFTEIEWLLHDKPVRSYDYYYDQVVCCGELFSSSLLYHHLAEEKVNAVWVDVRDIIRTDHNFRDASIDWSFTQQNIEAHISPLLDQHDVVITQGFVGSTDENESTTLGREGSDFTAAIFANLMKAGSVTIWKDVEAVMSADPKLFPDAVNIHELSYSEVIEMAYYGAQVIHPKTIKPLQNKHIPLLVKSFLDPGLEGTLISNKITKQLPPVIVVKNNQALLRFRSKDFSFVEDQPVQQLQDIYRNLKMKPTLSQNTAISLLCAFDHREEKITLLALDASEIFDVEVEKDLILITVRHYNQSTIDRLVKDKQVVLEQRTQETIQMLIR